MGFPEENNWTMTIVTNIYIYRQAMAFEYKEGRDREKKKNEMCLY